MLLKRRLPPTGEGFQGGSPSGAAGSHLVLGTLSAVVGHPINGYLPMPAWCTEQPDSSVREPPKEEPRALAPRGHGEKKFYSPKESESSDSSGSSAESSSTDGSEGDSDSDSESDSDSDSGSGSSPEDSSGDDESRSDDAGTSEYDDESDSSVGSDGSETSSSGSSSGGSSSESSETKGEEGLGLLIMGSGSSSNAAVPTTYGASAPAPHAQDLTGLVERMSVAAREDSASPQLGSSATAFGGELASLSTAGLREPGRPALALGRTSSASSSLSADPEGDTSASFPSTLLRQQASGGLKVDYQYRRGRVNALSRPSTTLTLRLTVVNHGEMPVRRIRVVAPRDGTPMEPFPEVQMLAAGATATVSLGIDFGGKAKDVSER